MLPFFLHPVCLASKYAPRPAIAVCYDPRLPEHFRAMTAVGPGDRSARIVSAGTTKVRT